MSHVRTQLVNAVATLLEAAPTNWSVVWKSRFHPARDIAGYVQVWTEGDDVEAEGIEAAHMQLREVTLVTRGRLRVIENEDDEDRVNTLAAELETKLTHTALNTALSNKVRRFHLVSTDIDQAVEDDERVFLDVTLTWNIWIYTVHGSPETMV